MTMLEVVLLGSLTPMAALLIGWWVLTDARRTTAKVKARASDPRFGQIR